MAYEVRKMMRPELDLAVEWAASEGWNPGLHDAVPFFRADPDGFLVGILDGEPVGCISAVAYPENFGFVGFYIVRPEFRGMGYGIRLWERAMETLAGRTIGLDGVVEQQANYARSGFELAYRNVRYEGHGCDAFEHPDIVPANTVGFDVIAEFDRQYFPSARPDFLQAWLRLADAQALVFQDGNAVRGWSVIRSCRDGFKVGPLFAESPDIAAALFEAQRGFAGKDAKVYLDIPEVNPDAQALVATHQMVKVFETARMYQGEIPTMELSGVYGVTTFELG